MGTSDIANGSIDSLRFGDRLRRLRRERDISQEEYATLVGTTQQTIARWESGDSLPQLRFHDAIASEFGVPVENVTDSLSREATESDRRDRPRELLPHQRAAFNAVTARIGDVAGRGDTMHAEEAELLRSLLKAADLL